MLRIERHNRKVPDARNTKRVTCACFVLLLSFSPTCFAINEAQFMEKVLAQDKLLEEAQIGLDIKQIEVDASRDNYKNWKVELYANLDYREQNLKRETTSRSIYTEATKRYPKEIGVAIQKRFLSHRGSLAAGIKRSKDKTIVGRSRSTKSTPKSYTLEEYSTDQYIRYNYPLLKNDFNATSLKTHRRDIIDLQNQQLLFYETKEDFLDDRLNDYLKWFLYQQQVLINREYLNTLQGLKPRDEADVATLKSMIYQIENTNSDTHTNLQAIKRKLAILLDDESILTEQPEFDLQQRAKLIESGIADYVKTRNRDLQRITLSMALNKIESDHYKNQSLPELDFTLRAEQNLSNGNSSYTTYADDDRITYSAGIEFSVPLGGSVTNRANLAKSRLGVRKLEISYQEKLQDILADIQLLNALLTLDETRLLASIDAATQSTQIELENYRGGQSSFRDLLQSYESEREAKLEHVDNVIDYQINRIKYDNLLDRIIMSP